MASSQRSIGPSPSPDDKPLALRKTPRLSAGKANGPSTVNRGSPNQQMLTSKNKDAVSSNTCKRASRSSSFSEPSSKKAPDATPRTVRRKRVSDPSGSQSQGKRKRVSKDMETRNDSFCWTCHKENAHISCEVCPRSFHSRCAYLWKEGGDEWVCPECDLVLKAENVDTRSSAMQALSIDQLCNLLKFAVSRMKHQCPEEFLKPVPLDQFPSYSNFIVHPMDLEMLEKNIKKKMYGCTESFLADAKWILHNCIIFNGYNHKLTSVAKALLKICKHEMSEIEVCPDCYHNAYTKRENWFQEPCCPPHLLIWAKLKGFPFWPAKAMRIVSGNVDVRFFGAHDRAWIPVAQCFLLSNDIPTTMKIKKKGVFEQSMEELAQHIKKVKDRFQVFRYAPFRAPIDGEELGAHIQSMLPGVNLKDFSRSSVGKSSHHFKFQPVSGPSGTESDSYASRNRMSQDSEAGVRGIKQEVVSPTIFSVKLLKYPVCEIPKLDHSKLYKPRAESMKKLESAIEKIKSFGKDLEAGEEGVPASPEDNGNKKEVSDDTQEDSKPSYCFVKIQAPFDHYPKTDDDQNEHGPCLPPKSTPDACEVSSTTSSVALKSSWSLTRNDGETSRRTRLASKAINEKQCPVVEMTSKRPANAALPSPMQSEHALSEEDDSAGPVMSEEEFPVEKTDVGPHPFESDDVDAKIEAGDGRIEEPDRPCLAAVPKTPEISDPAESAELKPALKVSLFEPISDDDEAGPLVENQCDPLRTTHVEENASAAEQTPESGPILEQISPVVSRNDSNLSEPEISCPLSGDSGDGNEQGPPVTKSASCLAETQTTELSDVGSPSENQLQESNAGVDLETGAGEDTGLTIFSVTSLSKESSILDATKSDESFILPERAEVPTPEPGVFGDGAVEEGELVIDLDRDKEEGQGSAGKSKKRQSRSPFGGIKLKERKVTKEKEKERKSSHGSRSKGKNNSQEVLSPPSVGGSQPGTSSGNGTVQTHLPMLSPLGLRDPRNVRMQQASPRSMPTLQPRPSISMTMPSASTSACPRPSEDTGLSKYSQKMVDFVRGTMEEMVKDLAKTGNPEATIKTLQLELEKLQWKHQQEMIEMKHNTDLILLEMRNSMESEKQRAMSDMRRQCEMERQKVVEETKKKQWCAFCGKEAIFYCCWNTSYCDYPCQQAHWPQHVNICSQTQAANESGGGEGRTRKATPNDSGKSGARRQGNRNQKQSEVPSLDHQVVLGHSQIQGGGRMTPAVAAVQVIPPNSLHNNSPFQLQYIASQSQATVHSNLSMQAPITVAAPFAAVSNPTGFSLSQGLAGPAPGTMFQQRPLQGSNLIFPIMSTHPSRPTMPTSHLPQSTQILVSHGMRPTPSVSFLRGPSHPLRGRPYLF